MFLVSYWCLIGVCFVYCRFFSINFFFSIFYSNFYYVFYFDKNWPPTHGFSIALYCAVFYLLFLHIAVSCLGKKTKEPCCAVFLGLGIWARLLFCTLRCILLGEKTWADILQGALLRCIFRSWNLSKTFVLHIALYLAWGKNLGRHFTRSLVALYF